MIRKKHLIPNQYYEIINSTSNNGARWIIKISPGGDYYTGIITNYQLMKEDVWRPWIDATTTTLHPIQNVYGFQHLCIGRKWTESTFMEEMFQELL